MFSAISIYVIILARVLLRESLFSLSKILDLNHHYVPEMLEEWKQGVIKLV